MPSRLWPGRALPGQRVRERRVTGPLEGRFCATASDSLLGHTIVARGLARVNQSSAHFGGCPWPQAATGLIPQLDALAK